MPHVIERLGHTINPDGEIRYSERRLSWKRADKIAGYRLDRRWNYCIIDGQICAPVRFTARCSGCGDSFCDDRGAGCRECGYTGVRRQEFWMPEDGSEPNDAAYG